MMPSRRAFLGLLAGAALDPERLLWRPGAKLISIPPARRHTPSAHYAVFFPAKRNRYKPGDTLRIAGHLYTVVEKEIAAPQAEMLRIASVLTAADHAIIARYWQMAVRVDA
jgi:hypothetical protein